MALGEPPGSLSGRNARCTVEARGHGAGCHMPPSQSPLLPVPVFTICTLFPPLKAFGAGLPASRMLCNTVGASYHRGAGAELACQCCPTHASLLAWWRRRRRTRPRHPASGPAGRGAASSPDAAPGGEEVFRYCGVFRHFLRCSAIPPGQDWWGPALPWVTSAAAGCWVFPAGPRDGLFGQHLHPAPWPEEPQALPLWQGAAAALPAAWGFWLCLAWGSLWPGGVGGLQPPDRGA